MTTPVASGLADAITRRQFAHRLLNTATGTVEYHALNAVVAWMFAESGFAKCNGVSGAAFNPLNTTLKTSGAVSPDWNSTGVRNYRNLQAGLDATISTLSEHFYVHLRAVLSKPGVTTLECCEAIEASPWGTGGVIFRARESFADNRDLFNNLVVGAA